MLEQLVHIVTTVQQTVNYYSSTSHTQLHSCMVPRASLDVKQNRIMWSVIEVSVVRPLALPLQSLSHTSCSISQ